MICEAVPNAAGLSHVVPSDNMTRQWQSIQRLPGVVPYVLLYAPV